MYVRPHLFTRCRLTLQTDLSQSDQASYSLAAEAESVLSPHYQLSLVSAEQGLKANPHFTDEVTREEFEGTLIRIKSILQSMCGLDLWGVTALKLWSCTSDDN